MKSTRGIDEEFEVLGYAARLLDSRGNRIDRTTILKCAKVDYSWWPPPAEHGFFDYGYMGVWPELNSLQAKTNAVGGPYEIIAVTVPNLAHFWMRSSWLLNWYAPYDAPVPKPDPATISLDWEFLGYDIADVWLNGVFWEKHKQPSSDSYVLLFDVKRAKRIAKRLSRDQRKYGEGPYFVFGLHSVMNSMGS